MNPKHVTGEILENSFEEFKKGFIRGIQLLGGVRKDDIEAARKRCGDAWQNAVVARQDQLIGTPEDQAWRARSILVTGMLDEGHKCAKEFMKSYGHQEYKNPGPKQA